MTRYLGISKFPNSKKIVEASGSNFASSFWFLSKEKRNALNTIYAYCRLTDDIVDQSPDPAREQDVRIQLDSWRNETLKSFQQKTSHPVLQELSAVVAQYHIPHELFHQLIDGVQMDLEKRSYKTFDELYPYCYRVASIVGLMCTEVFGYKNIKTKDYAVNLGVAFQLTNILRDLKTDAQRGRVYIPEEDLSNHGLSRENILTFADSPIPKVETINQFKALIDFECRRANLYYKKAKENLVAEDRPNLIAAEVMSAVYHCILKKIENHPLLVLDSKVRLSKAKLFSCILKGWLANRLQT